MADTHPIYQRPVIHCGKCSHPLVFPRKKETDAADIAAGRAVLAECVPCATAIQVPAELLKPSDHRYAPTTIARPWGVPKAVLTKEQEQMLKPPQTA